MKYRTLFGIILILITVLVSCSKENSTRTGTDYMDNAKNLDNEMDQKQPNQAKKIVDYKYYQDLNVIDDNYRTYYEVFLYSFYDSNGDGIGDINGLIEKLDYINDGDPNSNSDLGFNGIWLMPIMPSNSYHKYDVKDYYSIDPLYGTMEDFKRLIEECNKRGIKLIIDLVINHSSHMHPWFLSALKSLKVEPCGQQICLHDQLCRDHNPYVDYYNFVEGDSNRPDYYHTGVGNWYYEGVFSHEMPDLNLDNKSLRKDLEDIMSFWLELGVGGFRLDAALHFFTNDTDKNIEVLSWLNTFIKEQNEANYLVAEVWTNFTNYSKYYSSGIDSIFNFAFAMESGKIVKTLNYAGADQSGKAFGEAMIQVQKGLSRYSSTAIDAPFFTNHDTARAAGYFIGNSDKIKMAGGMNLMMSGNVFVYYGEELGMSGSGRDENKRAPMQWTEASQVGMTIGPRNMETVTHNFGTVEKQMEDPLSIYSYYKRAIRLRNENPEIARGVLDYITEIQDIDICAVTKTYNNSTIIILYNVSEAHKEVSLSKSIYPYEVIRGYLTVQGEEVILEDESIKLPPYSIVLLK